MEDWVWKNIVFQVKNLETCSSGSFTQIGFWKPKTALRAKSTWANKNEICSQSCTFKRTTSHGKTNAEPQQVEGSLQL